MARALIVGCGCRGRALAGALREDGHSVRGTTRDRAGLAAIEGAGAEAVIADPDMLGTVLTALDGVSVVCWLMGTASGHSAEAVHGPRLQTMLEKLVDTPARGLVYEPGGWSGGVELVRDAEQRWMMPVAVVEEAPASHDAWLAAARAGVEHVLSG